MTLMMLFASSTSDRRDRSSFFTPLSGLIFSKLGAIAFGGNASAVAYPLILGGGFYDNKDPDYAWVMRTRLGVCLVHEIRAWDYQPAFHYEMLHKLFLFGYGEKAAENMTEGALGAGPLRR